MLIIAVLFIFAAVFLLVLSLSWKDQQSPMTARIAAVRGERIYASYGEQVKAEPLGDRVLGPMGRAMGTKLRVLLPHRWIQYIDKRLVQAGEPIALSGFLVAAFLSEATMLLFGFTMVVSSGAVGITSFGLLGVSAILGVFLPRMWLENRVRHRQATIWKSLPDAFDLVTVCVEAGLGLDAALARVTEKVEGPFAEELSVVLHEVSFGKLSRDALQEMAQRCGVSDLTTFINAVIQAESMGTSIAPVLRVQAESMRVRRRQRAEQQAYKAPVKMIFPLVLCIFPTIFIVILGPAGIRIYETLTQQS
jgi:tight adherence protein C